MANRPQPAKRQEWRTRLERFSHADMTVADFCAAEGVSVASFYQWRRKLEADASVDTPALKFVPLDLPAVSKPSATTVMRVDLPGGVRVRFEVTGSQDEPS